MAYAINPAWTAYNNLQNEGGEGYNPHAKYVTVAATQTATQGAARMIRGKRRTHADAVTFAKNSLSGEQKIGFLAEVRQAFPELY